MRERYLVRERYRTAAAPASNAASPSARSAADTPSSTSTTETPSRDTCSTALLETSYSWMRKLTAVLIIVEDIEGCSHRDSEVFAIKSGGCATQHLLHVQQQRVATCACIA